MIEIEFRARFSKDEYNRLKNFLDHKAKVLGPDNKAVYFFHMPDKLLKVVNNTSKKSAKIVLKLNKIGNGSDFEEVEIPISQKDVEKAVKVFKSLGFENVMITPQKRVNYLYKGVELALKYSSVWGYHLELEVLVRSVKKKSEAEDKIFAVAKELGIKIMSEKELADFVSVVEKDQGWK